MLLGIFMTSLCKQYWQFFLAQGLVLGVGMSFIAIPASGMVPRYFKRNRGLATGISVAGSSLGGLIWPIALDQMLHHDSIGFPWAIRIAGFIMMPCCLVCILTIRLPLKPQQQTGDAEAADNMPATEKSDEKDKKKDLSVLRKPPFILLCSGLFVVIFGFFVPFFYISTYAVSLGMSSSLAFYLVSIVNAASLFGRILPGIVADRWGRFNMLVVSAFTAGIVAFCWSAAMSVAGLVVWAAAYGFFSGVSKHPRPPFSSLRTADDKDTQAILSLQIACATTLADADSAGAAVGIAMGATSLP